MQVVVVYIREAHASDTWPMKFSHERPSPQTLEQRVEYARDCVEELGLPAEWLLRVDGMEDSFNAAFGAWPTCYYVVGEGQRLQYVGECPLESDSASYDIGELFAFLRA